MVCILAPPFYQYAVSPRPVPAIQGHVPRPCFKEHPVGGARGTSSALETFSPISRPGPATSLPGMYLFVGCCFYRADFVIQAGLTKATGGNVANPYGRLTVNESKGHNGRGSVAIAHWDCVEGCGTSCTKHAPDCGGSEWFINLKVVHLVVHGVSRGKWHDVG